MEKYFSSMKLDEYLKKNDWIKNKLYAYKTA